jgi:hypothetical protein
MQNLALKKNAKLPHCAGFEGSAERAQSRTLMPDYPTLIL